MCLCRGHRLPYGNTRRNPHIGLEVAVDGFASKFLDQWRKKAPGFCTKQPMNGLRQLRKGLATFAVIDFLPSAADPRWRGISRWAAQT